MKNKDFEMVLVLLLSALVVALAGIVVKVAVVLPLDIEGYENKNIMELPILYFTDSAFQYFIASARAEGAPIVTTSTEATEPPSSGKPPVPMVPQQLGDGSAPELGAAVDESWFENVLFLGDSRVAGLKLYARCGNADYFCDVGMQVYNAQKKELEDRNFPKQSLQSLLSNKHYDKIILCFGLNEAGYPTGSFRQKYGQLLQEIRDLQPDAVLILHGIMSVTLSKAESASYFALEHLTERNAIIQGFADGETIFYIDVNPWFTDENGYLYESMTNDGCHPTVEGYRHWCKWFYYAVAELGV